MAIVRIVCKADPRVDGVPHTAIRVNALLAAWPNVRVLLIDDDGSEREIDCVEGVMWSAAANAEPTRATLQLIGVEIDALAELTATTTNLPTSANSIPPLVAADHASDEGASQTNDGRTVTPSAVTVTNRTE